MKKIYSTILQMIKKYLFFVENEDHKSYDLMDIWSTNYGKWARQKYFDNKFLGTLFVSPIILVDLLYPNIRKYISKKRTFPICHAQMGLGYLGLRRIIEAS